MKKNLPDFVLSNICLKCDGCCRFAQADSEWRPKTDSEEDLEMYIDCIDESRYLKVEVEQGICKCIFLDLDDNKCDIYDNRPFECRLYPFMLVRDKDSVYVAVHLSCPFVQEHLDDEMFVDHVSSLREYFVQQDVKDFVRRHEFLAGEYTDYRNEIKKLFEISI